MTFPEHKRLPQDKLFDDAFAELLEQRHIQLQEQQAAVAWWRRHAPPSASPKETHPPEDS